MKANQPNLYAQLKALPWGEVRTKYSDRSREHGRLETRVVKILTVTVTGLGIDFPHATQVAQIVRHRTDARTAKCTRGAVYVITDLTSRQAPPERIARIARSSG